MNHTAAASKVITVDAIDLAGVLSMAENALLLIAFMEREGYVIAHFTNHEDGTITTGLPEDSIKAAINNVRKALKDAGVEHVPSSVERSGDTTQ